MQVITTDDFDTWFKKLKDHQAKRIITARIYQLSCGLLGDIKSVGNGVSELRIFYGPGYRLYCKQEGNLLIILLCGGTKNSQSRDIAKAKKLANELSTNKLKLQ